MEGTQDPPLPSNPGSPEKASEERLLDAVRYQMAAWVASTTAISVFL